MFNLSIVKLEAILTRKVSQDHAAMLQAPTVNEIKNAPFSIKKGAAPMPDGYTGDVLIKNWSFLGD